MDYKRPCCKSCGRPEIACLCRLVEAVETSVELVIWQHPSEQRRAKGTAKLLHLCLPNSRLVCAQQQLPADLKLDVTRCALLYPAAQGEETTASEGCRVDQLLVLDGTWRKSRKLLYLNPWLAALPRLSLSDVHGQYRIRKAEKGSQLSTFEAAVAALAGLEGGNKLRALDVVFERFQQQYESFIG
ncbi:tRNA-uridine aminocarboxypropyltransferase [Teredinibacter franksiae]|uniref:tRNA-uridine aminocarboxypropyltransferase n=1 Tax=Teredinibacter franksiae TaxID=2761453 RepID=UPI001627C931|nr:tRNA-uridine aminocarboxypropyltransferase [Teredinibacter franksiae]